MSRSQPTHRARHLRQVARDLAVLATVVVVSSCTSTSKSSSPPAPDSSCNATRVAEQVLPSVVTVSAAKGSAAQVGSGEVIRSDGRVLTNNHVVAAAASGGTISVLLPDGVSLPATIQGRDAQTDLAVLKVNTTKSLPVIAMGSSQSVKIGEPVVALGAPLGLPGSVTAGIVSGLDRTVQIPAENGKTAALLAALQTDAAINPGNSGGALANCSGQLVGVPTANAAVSDTSTGGGSIGIGFAIPVDLARAIADQLIAAGKVTHSYLGMAVAPVPADPSTPDQSGGLRVASVDPAGPSAAAGLKAGDVITAIDGKPATDADQLAILTITKAPGAKVVLTYRRGEVSAEATVTLAAQPA
jgi:putative serine protease PepD